MVKMRTVLVSTVSISQAFLLKNVSSFFYIFCKRYSHFFSKNIRFYAIFNDQTFNDMLTNGIICFEQLGLGALFHTDTFCSVRRVFKETGKACSDYEDSLAEINLCSLYMLKEYISTGVLRCAMYAGIGLMRWRSFFFK